MYFTKSKAQFAALFLLASWTGLAQENLTGYWQPQLSLNYDVSANYSHNFSLGSRNYVYKDEVGRLSARQIDVSHFSNFKIGYTTSLGAGVQYRFREIFENDKENELRFVQQFNSTKKYRTLRIGNRLRTEQRITNSQTIHRFRYRFAVDLPLMGLNLDIGEPYLVATTESLLSVGKNVFPEYDQRFTGQLGWLLSKKSKLQLGLEYRFEDYTHQTQHVLFFLNSLVISL